MILVAEAANGREAIQQFRTHRPDVTLMDLQMPEMNSRSQIQNSFPDAIHAACAAIHLGSGVRECLHRDRAEILMRATSASQAS
jgi:DNA-binding NarL/FixJ family response regulator